MASIRSLAKQLGVSASTVSLALSGSGKVSSGTRERVIRCAKRAGYRPSARLRELNEQLRWKKGRLPNSSIALVVTGRRFVGQAQWQELVEGVKGRAEARGNRLDILDIDGLSLTSARVRTILVSRGIGGIVYLDLGLEKLAVPRELKAFDVIVAGGTSASGHCGVTVNRAQALWELLNAAREAGYERPALLFEQQGSAVERVYRSAYLGWCERELRSGPIVPSMYCSSNDSGWRFVFESFRPDFVVGVSPAKGFQRFLKDLNRWGFSNPSGVGLGALENTTAVPGVPAVVPGFGRLGAAAVEMLVEKMRDPWWNDEQSPRLQMIESEWRNRDSLVTRATAPLQARQ